jgi:cob(I)alamin adenosyltransferase
VKIYTKTGDDGLTGLFGGHRVPKHDARVEATGTLDELNAALGLARSFGLSVRGDEIVARVQSELFTLGAEIGAAPGLAHKLRIALIGDAHIATLEKEIDAIDARLPPLKAFILPGGCLGAAALHSARTLCRRAERRLLILSDLRPTVMQYVNRLSDHLFVLARSENYETETSETQWSGTSAPKVS